MAPTIPSLAQSESKAKFFDRLSMRTDNMKDKRVYSAMKVIFPSLQLGRRL